MEDGSESAGARPRIDAVAKAAFLDAISGGARIGEAAAAYGVTVQAFRKARRRDPVFDAGWRAAHAASAEAERRAAREGDGGGAGQASGAGEERIVCNNRRVFQRRRMRHVRFDARRQAVFLSHFAWSCDAIAAAAEAGVSERTVYRHLRTDAEFHALFQDALEQGYVRLEAEAVRQRLVAQERLRAAVEASGPGADARCAADTDTALAGEFERVMKLLARWDRKQGGGPAMGRHQPSARQAWTFDEAILALEKRLKALGFIKEGDGPPAEDGVLELPAPGESGAAADEEGAAPA